MADHRCSGQHHCHKISTARTLSLAAFAGLALLVAPREATAAWQSLRSDHFQVVGNATAGDLRAVALRLEQFREVVAQLNPAVRHVTAQIKK